MKRTGVPARKGLLVFASFGVFHILVVEMAYIMPQEAMLKALSKLGGHEAGFLEPAWSN